MSPELSETLTICREYEAAGLAISPASVARKLGLSRQGAEYRLESLVRAGLIPPRPGVAVKPVAKPTQKATPKPIADDKMPARIAAVRAAAMRRDRNRPDDRGWLADALGRLDRSLSRETPKNKAKVDGERLREYRGTERGRLMHRRRLARLRLKQAKTDERRATVQACIDRHTAALAALDAELDDI